MSKHQARMTNDGPPSSLDIGHSSLIGHWVLLIAVLLLALFLPLRGLGDQSLWFDEAASVRIVKQDTATMFASIKSDERIPPLHYVILHAWVRVFGDGEFSVRFPSVLAGTAAV